MVRVSSSRISASRPSTGSGTASRSGGGPAHPGRRARDGAKAARLGDGSGAVRWARPPRSRSGPPASRLRGPGRAPDRLRGRRAASPRRAGGAARPGRARRAPRRGCVRSGPARRAREGSRRGLGHGPRGVGGRERPLVEPLRWGEQAAPRNQVRIAGPAARRLEPDVGAGPRARAAAPRRAAAARRCPAASSSGSARRALRTR